VATLEAELRLSAARGEKPPASDAGGGQAASAGRSPRAAEAVLEAGAGAGAGAGTGAGAGAAGGRASISEASARKASADARERRAEGAREGEGKGPSLAEVVGAQPFSGHSGGVRAVAVAEDGAAFASAGGCTVQVQALAPAGAELAATIMLPNGVPASALAWTRTARGAQALLVVGAEEGGGIKVWEARGKVMAAEHAAPDGLPHVLALAASPDGAAFAAALADAPRARAALQLWSLRAGKLVRSIEAGGADSSGSKDGCAAVLAVHHNHNGSLLAGACADGFVRVWDVRSASDLDRPIMAWRAHAGRPATAVRFSPDETALFSAGAGTPPPLPRHPAPQARPLPCPARPLPCPATPQARPLPCPATLPRPRRRHAPSPAPPPCPRRHAPSPAPPPCPARGARHLSRGRGGRWNRG
jgi:hypothetical protein